MTEIIRLSNTDFLQKVVKLDGNDWRFANRPYIFPIINGDFKRKLLIAARQTEKSTSLAGIMLARACLIPNLTMLYVSPTGKQTGVFSRKKIDEAFEVSPHLRKNFYPGVKGFRVEEKRLKNYSTMYFRSAFHDADSIRGITAPDVYKDEIQDMLADTIPVIDACAQKRMKEAKFVSSGTAKTFDNPIHVEFEKSTGNEWTIKCTHCGHWNMLSIDLVLLDKPGLWCQRCQGALNSLYGCWVRARQSEVDGFRLPHIILPENDISWKDLYFKMRNYDQGALMNEVFGVSYDNGSKPVTRDQLIKACSPERDMWTIPPFGAAGHDFYAGIDWGQGDSGFTILTIGYLNPATNKFTYVFAKRYIGKEAEPENVVISIAKTLTEFNVRVVSADKGFGWGVNERLARLLSGRVYVTFAHSVIKSFVSYNAQSENYVTNRTEVMTDLFNAIKNETVEFYRWGEFEEIGKDILNVTAEYSETMRQIRYVHNQPDDGCHALLYARLGWLIATHQVPTTRYTRDEEISTTTFYND